MNFFPDPANPPLSGESDRGLLRRFCQNRDEAAFTELVRRYAPLVRSVAYRRIGDAQLAEDAAQQTFIVLARKAAQIKSVPCLAAWLHRAALYEAAALQRREGRHQRRQTIAHEISGPGGDPLFVPQEGYTEVLRRLDESLAALGETDRALLVLHYLENISYDQIAVRLGLSPAAAQRRGHRALEKLSRQVRVGGGAGSISTGIMLAGLIRPDSARAASAPLARQSLQSASAVSAGGAVTAAVVALLSSPVAWTGATVVLAGAAVWTFSTMQAGPPGFRRASPSPPGMAAASVLQPPFKPLTPDEKLTPEEIEFLRLARLDPAAAYEWTRDNIKSDSVDWALPLVMGSHARVLADRDFPAAERFLAAVKTISSRQEVFAALLNSKAARGLPSALTWGEDYLKKTPLKELRSFPERRITDPDTLQKVSHPLLREKLIRSLIAHFAEFNEAGLEGLAEQLAGDEQKWVRDAQLNALAGRGDPRILDLLGKNGEASIKNYEAIGGTFPQPFLDWVLAHPGAVGQQDAGMVFYIWVGRDARGAAAWYAGLPPAERMNLNYKIGFSFDSNPTFLRHLRSLP